MGVGLRAGSEGMANSLHKIGGRATLAEMGRSSISSFFFFSRRSAIFHTDLAE
jgi:hypothetical protein